MSFVISRRMMRPESGKLSIRTVDVAFSDKDGAYFHKGAVAGELAITSPIQAPFDGMSLTVMQRMEDGSVKVHNPPKPAAETTQAEQTKSASNSEGSAQ